METTFHLILPLNIVICVFSLVGYVWATVQSSPQLNAEDVLGLHLAAIMSMLLFIVAMVSASLYISLNYGGVNASLPVLIQLATLLFLIPWLAMRTGAVLKVAGSNFSQLWRATLPVVAMLGLGFIVMFAELLITAGGNTAPWYKLVLLSLLYGSAATAFSVYLLWCSVNASGFRPRPA